MRYDVVLVTYNSEKWLRGCVAALAKLDYDLQQIHLIFADNASTDGTLELLETLKKEYPLFGGFTVFSTGRNAGFGAGCNAGAKHGDAPYLFFMNVDTAICSDALSKMDAGIKLHSDAGAWEMRQIPKEAVKWYDPVTLETNWCSGAAFVVPREVFREIGGFDESIFMYCEDVDLSWRIRVMGKKLYYVPDAMIHHYETQTYAGKISFANRNILLNNYYLRLKFGTVQDRQAFWKMYRHLQTLPEWSDLLDGTEAELKKKRCSRRIEPNNFFSPCFNQLSYDSVLFFSDEECQPVEAEVPPLISILIRTHARPHLLRQALQTIANQTVKNGFEVVIIEDGEATAQAVVEEFSCIPIRYHATGEPIGRSAAGNLAARLAQGAYCCFFDEDDWLLVNYVETWQRLCVQYPEKKLFFAGSIEIAGSYDAAGVWRTEWGKACEVKGIDRLTVAVKNPVPIQAVLFARELFEQYGGMDEDLDAFEDWAMWQRYVSVEVPVVWNASTSVFKVPCDVVEVAKRNLHLAKYASRCFERGRALPVNTSMGELAEHFWTVSEQECAIRAEAEEYRKTAQAIEMSTSWRITKPIRALGRLLVKWGSYLCGAEIKLLPENTSKVKSVGEYIAFIDAARHSLSWKMTAFLRRR